MEFWEIRCGIPSLINQIHVSLLFYLVDVFYLIPSSFRCRVHLQGHHWQSWASSTEFQLTGPHEWQRWFPEQVELVPAEAEGIMKSCIKLTGHVLSSYVNAMHVQVCKVLGIDSAIATSTSSPTQPLFSRDVINFYPAAETKKMLSSPTSLFKFHA